MKQLEETTMRPLFRISIWLTISAAFTAIVACVSVTLKTDPITPAEGLIYKDPPSPFKRGESKNYPSWIHAKDGNIISIISECSQQDLPLANLQNDVVLALDDGKIVKEESLRFADQAAVKIWIQGTVQGVESQILALIFKKGLCNYTISYGGRAQHFENDLSTFNVFLAEVKVP